MRSFENYVKSRDMNEMAIPSDLSDPNEMKSKLIQISNPMINLYNKLINFFDESKNKAAQLMPTFLDEKHHRNSEISRGHEILRDISREIISYDKNFDSLFHPDKLSNVNFAKLENEEYLHDFEINSHKMSTNLISRMNNFNDLAREMSVDRAYKSHSGYTKSLFPGNDWMKNDIKRQALEKPDYEGGILTKEADPMMKKVLSIYFYNPTRSLTGKIKNAVMQLKKMGQNIGLKNLVNQ